MPFDGSGNFTRLYNWQQDRDNGIRILAVRMDGEFDNFAAGMNVVFFRNGLVPMSGNLSMGQNYIIGLGAGTANNPAIRFADSPMTGMFLDSVGRIGFAGNGSKKLTVSDTGVDAYGYLKLEGQDVWTAGNFNKAEYARLDGATFTGNVRGPNIGVDDNFNMKISGGNPWVVFDTNDYFTYDRAGNTLYFNINQNSRFAVNDSGVNSTNGIFSGSVSAQQGFFRNTINTFPLVTRHDSYSGIQMQKADNTTTLAYLFNNGTWTFLNTVSGGASFQYNGTNRISYDNDSVTFYKHTTSLGNLSGVDLRANRNDGTGALYFGSGMNNYLYYNGTDFITAGGDLFVKGSKVWTAGTFNPNNYALLSGANFTGAINATTVGLGAGTNFYLGITNGGVNHNINFDNNDYMIYDVNSNKLTMYINGTSVWSVDSAGNMKVRGNVTGNATP